ncbi:antitoxin YefM [Desulfofundulus australicus DSM 11792]|uniref:Antitoxin n=1 Tax=Desulfofundulus australicus DSM 11792 TaxID=1121425 RepID=A0A1M5E3J9_9FIRM|nr:type II toxin-antitoxin system Phd/YefM family antitoxin [Desulfofundulus australicus]SHF73817.1 antitoxin YefM [Desulfofundulus australicus DSM 11792]
MENIINVENARRILGDLISRVNENKQPVVITRRSKEKAILLDYDEYVRLKTLAEKAKEDRLIEALEKIQQAVAEAGIPYEAVAEAIREVRSR